MYLNKCTGAEVKSGEPLEVDPGQDVVLHLSQVITESIIFDLSISFFFFPFFINDVCDAVSKVSFHCRLLLERLRRTNQMKEFACL